MFKLSRGSCRVPCKPPAFPLSGIRRLLYCSWYQDAGLPGCCGRLGDRLGAGGDRARQPPLFLLRARPQQPCPYSTLLEVIVCRRRVVQSSSTPRKQEFVTAAGSGRWLGSGLGRDDEALLWESGETAEPEDLCLERHRRDAKAYGFLCFALLA